MFCALGLRPYHDYNRNQVKSYHANQSSVVQESVGSPAMFVVTAELDGDRVTEENNLNGADKFLGDLSDDPVSVEESGTNPETRAAPVPVGSMSRGKASNSSDFYISLWVSRRL